MGEVIHDRDRASERRAPAGRRGLVNASLALLATAGACARPGEPRPPGPVASTMLALATELGATPSEVAGSWPLVEQIASRVAARHAHSRADWIDDLNAVVFGELGFQREIESTDVRYFRLPSVVTERRGTCVGLGALYLVLAERLGSPLDAVMVPGHFFVRTRGGAPRNVELLRRGEAMPDAWYRSKYGPWPDGDRPYFRPLTLPEIAAVHRFNLGNHLRATRDLAGAAAAYTRVVAEMPGFAEAAASLGAVEQLEGALDEAQAAYEQAARARPDLPGLEQNLALLKRERDLSVAIATARATTQRSQPR